MVDAVLNQIRNTALIMGVIAFIGLALQKKSGTEITKGTVKTIIGFMIFSIGTSWLQKIVEDFMALFNAAFGISGVQTQPSVAAALALGKYGSVISIILIIGFISNLIIAKFTPFKAIFLTGQHFLYFACVIGLVLIAANIPMWITAIVGGILLGFVGAAFPTMCQPYMNKITGSDNLAIGHFSTIAYWLSGYIGKLIGKIEAKHKKKSDSSSVKLPKFFEMFRDFVFSIALFMVVTFYIVVFACMFTGHADIVYKMSGTDIWFIYPLIEGLQFSAGMSVLIYGVRQFIEEITAAFVAISEKYIPNSKPAVDAPAIFPFAPTAVLIGFIGAFIGSLVGMGAEIALASSVVMIPAANICFFSGGTAAIFGNVYGGWKGALVGSFIEGVLSTTLPLLLYPSFQSLGIGGASFPNVDYNIFGGLLQSFLRLFGLS
ncbi:PTS sugar transporter subunit IIC [Lacticaseibacillus paracasei]|uniref:PTS ascorbate transporter subunit IIC n=1 Tax=Lacticaseibacillus paracasei TaxID=1597 RepID=UPI0030CF3634